MDVGSSFDVVGEVLSVDNLVAGMASSRSSKSSPVSGLADSIADCKSSASSLMSLKSTAVSDFR